MERSQRRDLVSTPSIAIFGPTASGKTRLSLLLAEALGAEILSADSRQVYRGLDIGTAKVSREERIKVRHHGIDICDPRQPYSTGEYRRYADKVIADIRTRGCVPLIVGGTGLYLSSLLTDFLCDEDDPRNLEVMNECRARIAARRAAGDHEELYAELSSVDPESAAKYADRNPRRVDRALVYSLVNGIPFSTAHRTRTIAAHKDVIVFVIERERAELSDRIRRRVGEMWESGLEDEVRTLVNDGVPRNAQSLATVGYREMLEYLDGNVSMSDAQEATIIATRQYAKRQRTWARHQFTDARRLTGSDEEMMRSVLKEFETHNH